MNITFSSDLLKEYIPEIRRITESSGFFTPAEVNISVELAEDLLSAQEASPYRFHFSFTEGRLAGYTSYGHIDGTDSSFDLYWIAVDNKLRKKNIGSALIEKTEAMIKNAGGTRIYAETSSKPLYEPTRNFYLKHNYRAEAVLEDFYRKGDSKVIFVKILSGC